MCKGVGSYDENIDIESGIEVDMYDENFVEIISVEEDK